ncbi:FAD-binding oxidoreductase [Bacillus thuringiensis]|uniref:FAD-binding oxidoreductase n=1 Tax=Bacillus thuringiensis TaxID=1428 RepID=UPI00125FAA07|nr:FAD-binding oxidoreductase [Bacillus thuringiensis]KAB5636926.1 FAD-binding oxidoreductase [Bacillus thuringiensis]HDR5271693.1 FAD-binding oxidoreductase [Bacillus thuringiensis]
MLRQRDKLLEEWRKIVGEEFVLSSQELIQKELADVGHFTTRDVIAVISPGSVLEVEELFGVMKEQESYLPFYPISTGKNWGQGSKKPTGNECVLLDMHRMNRIIEINLQYGYAIIEPGVTQWQMSEALQGTTYSINVTGSCKDTSIIGNALDRGLGFNRLRDEDLLALEVVLGNGKRIKTGRFYHNPAAAIAWEVPYYAGPDISSLFFQSNLGIVTAAIIQLIPRNECTKMISGQVSKSNLKQAIDSLLKAKREGLLNSILKIYNESALKTYKISPSSEEAVYGFYGAYFGRKEVVNAIGKVLYEDLLNSDIEQIQIYDETSLLEEKKIVFDWYSGQPDLCESAHSAFDLNHCNADKEAVEGWLFFLPDLPASGENVITALNILEDTAKDFSVLINSTVNIITECSIRLVVSIRFQRDPQGITKGHSALEYLYQKFSSHGFYPSRYDIDHRNGRAIYGEGDYLDTLISIKKAIDPQCIIAPEHYIP